MLCLLLERSGSVFGCLATLGVSMFKTCQASLQVPNQKPKNTRAQQKRQAIQDTRLGLYRACDADAAVALYIFSGYDVEIAGRFVMKRTTWERHKRIAVNWSSHIHGLFLKLKVTVASVLEPSTPANKWLLVPSIFFRWRVQRSESKI